MKIRQATPADNQALLELSRRSPMAARLVVNNDRTPDYFYIDELLGDQASVFVADDAGRIIGTVAVVFRNVLYREVPIPVAYIGGIKIENPAQNRLLAFRLMKHVMGFLIETPVKFGFYSGDRCQPGDGGAAFGTRRDSPF
ncbi:MAG: GNAT family N-acetyltransferase [Fidelibacterota bacterium]